MAARVTADVADFVLGAHAVSEDVLDVARRAFVDTVAVAVLGRGSRVGEGILRYVEEQQARGPAGVLGGDERTSAELAALANGTLSHALDFDDTNHVLEGHSSAHLVPAVLAAGEQAAATYRDCLEAYLVGYQVESAIGRGINPQHFRSGFHPTGTIATLGAAAAAARLRRLDRSETVYALAIAASAAAGIRANVGTMTKPLHAGQAAAAGVRAVGLAALGWDASSEALEGPYGFALTHAGGAAPRFDEMLATLRSGWIVTEPAALVVKPFPCCAGAHPTIQAALDIRARAGAQDIVGVVVSVSDILPTVLVHDRPTTGNEARFSLRYTLARALVSGRVAIRDFEDSALGDPAVTAMMDRIEVAPSDADLGNYGTTVTARLSDGRELHASVPDERVEGGAPITDDRLFAKLHDCVGGSDDAAQAIWSAVRHGDDYQSIDAVVGATRASRCAVQSTG